MIKTEKIAEGKYKVRVNGDRIPGDIIGAKKVYILYIGGVHMGQFKRLKSAAAHAAEAAKVAGPWPK